MGASRIRLSRSLPGRHGQGRYQPPIAGAEVILRGTGYSRRQITGSSGEFKFEHVREEPGTLVVRAPGFEPFEQAWGAASTKLQIVLRPATVAQQLTVTATRTPTRLEDSPASVVELSRENLDSAGTFALDDALREVPGFSLFRRSGSRTANPTSQGVSLRGLGASGASRALVLSGDTPQNDPFGGWIYWDRIPHPACRDRDGRDQRGRRVSALWQ